MKVIHQYQQNLLEVHYLEKINNLYQPILNMELIVRRSKNKTINYQDSDSLRKLNELLITLEQTTTCLWHFS